MSNKEPKQLLFVLFLNKDECLDDILTFFLEIGISGATVIESVGMGRILARNIPIFAGFKDLLGGNRPHNQTILAVIDESVVSELVQGLELICGDFNEPGTGLFLILPVIKVWGMIKEFD